MHASNKTTYSSSGNNIVHRSELFEKLNSGLSRKLILVSAPAGFGKTTIISDWINQHKIPTVWFSLDNGDNDPADFLSYIISGIQSIHKEFGKVPCKLLNSPNKPSSRINCRPVNQRNTQYQSKLFTGTRRFSSD